MPLTRRASVYCQHGNGRLGKLYPPSLCAHGLAKGLPSVCGYEPCPNVQVPTVGSIQELVSNASLDKPIAAWGFAP